MDISFHYPHELTTLLIETIPLLSKAKKDVLLFFQGAGVAPDLLRDLALRVKSTPDDVNKYEIVRTVLTRLNEKGEQAIRERREIIRRVTEFEDFSVCWPDDQLKAKGLVSEVRRVVNVKDSFTRIHQERNQERSERISQADEKQRQMQERKAAIATLRDDLAKLFFEPDARKRGKALEPVLNRLFELHGILLRDAFTLRGAPGEGIIEQIDGAIVFDGDSYLVEMKWINEPIGPGDISQHLVRVFGRGHARGVFISASEYTPATLQICRESLRQSVFVLCTLQEIVLLLEREADLREFLKCKVNAAINDKNPLHFPMS